MRLRNAAEENKIVSTLILIDIAAPKGQHFLCTNFELFRIRVLRETVINNEMI
jgi:hypothetical protein